MTIHQVDDVFCISSHQCWLPGTYESERAANYAFRFPDEVLTELQESVNPGGIITFEMLQQKRREMKAVIE